ncbi:MAG: colanic acid biosynthesis acetyltransferase WcaF [Bacteroidetes bacterium]|nr:MAG: colanic acid biosynthesis acetyltransferase WcaF [Bacteroidota bacterium]
MPASPATTDLSVYDNSWYDPGGGRLRRLLWYVVNALFFINPLNPLSGLKVWWLRIFGAKIGQGVIIKPAVNIKYPWRLSVGDHVWIGERVWIDNLDEVVLGDHVCLSQGAMLLTGNHNYRKPTFDLMIAPIKLDAGVWIGAQSLVGPGVRAGSHAVLSAGSVMTQDMRPYTIYRGNPATALKTREIE